MRAGTLLTSPWGISGKQVCFAMEMPQVWGLGAWPPRSGQCQQGGIPEEPSRRTQRAKVLAGTMKVSFKEMQNSRAGQ